MLLLSQMLVTQSLTKQAVLLTLVNKRLNCRLSRLRAARALNPLLSKNACFPSFYGLFWLKNAGEEALSAVSFTTRCKNFAARLRADSIKGSAAIEFAMIAPIFFVILMGTIEAGVMFFAQSALQNALNDTARLVRTGQTACYTTSAGSCVPMTQAQFKTKMCGQVSALLTTCTTGGLQFDVNAYPSGYSAAANSSPLDSSKNLNTLNTFNVGGACDVVLVRAFYKWPVFTPGIGFFMANMAGNFHLLATAAAFRNEPFNTSTGGCT